MIDDPINEIITILSHSGFDDTQMSRITSTIKIILTNYNVSKKRKDNKDINKLVELYLNCKRLEGRSSNTLCQYKGVIEWLLTYSKKIPETITSYDIRNFLTMVKESGKCCDRSIDKYREYIQHFYRWLSQEGLIEKDPTINISKIKYDTKEIQPLNRNELDRMRKSCADIRCKAIVETLYTTGCRVSELVNIKLSDINWSDRSIEVYGKGKKYRTVYITKECASLLNRYITTRCDSSDYLFVSIRKPYSKLSKGAIESIIGHLARESNIDKHVTPHVLRHTFATLALQSGMDITIISKILGHSNINTTMIYANINKNDIRNAHQIYIR